MPVPFKFYADFECILKSVESNEDFYTEKYQDHIPCSFFKPIVVYREENTADIFIEAIPKEYEYCKKVMKKHLNKKLIMAEENEKKTPIK